MERSIIEHFEKILQGKGGKLPMISLSGHLAELSQKERKYIKKLGGLDKLITKYPDTFLVYGDDVYHIGREDKNKDSSAGDIGNGNGKEDAHSASQDKRSTVNLESAKDDPCTVCSDPIEIYAIGECSHPICFRCSTKMRVLCEDKNCPVCRQKLDLVVFSKKLMAIDEHDVESYIRDRKYGIAFETIRICEQKSALLRHVCPKCPNQVFETFQRLEAHARDKHQLYYCDICVRQLKIFTEERKTYTKTGLKKHIEAGDADSTRGGHPLCQFCEYHYLDNDELLRHLRLHHCSCRICDQDNEGQKNYQFYADKNSLLDHQRDNHYPCEHPDCIDLDLIPAFKEEIDFQSHNLQYHSGQKSKLEKRADQRINVPFTYERKKAKAKKILSAEKDVAGGINVTGIVARRVERMYSFIERDDAPGQFLENVFFDLEAAELEIDDDMREHFQPGDRVSAYALPCTNPHAKSKWKAQKVEKLEEFSDNDQDYEVYHEEVTNPTTPEITTNEFPSLASFPTTYSTSTLGGWSKLAQAKPAVVPKQVPVNVAKKKPSKPDYLIGYVHKNLSDKFGFIQEEKYGFSFEDNVYFNLESYNLRSEQPTHDLRTVFSPGDKVCYILDPGPTRENAKAKYRSQVVWKYSHNAENIPSIDPDGFKLVSGKPSGKTIPPNLEKVSFQHQYKLEALAERFKKKIQTKASQPDVETKNAYPPQESSVAGRSHIDSSVVIIEEVVGTSQPESIRSRTSSRSSVDVSENKGPLQSSKSAGEVILSLVQPVTGVNSNPSNSTNGVPRHSQLARVLQNTASDEDARPANSQTTDSEMYSSSDDDYSEDEEVGDSNDNTINDPQHQLFIDVLATCINNKTILKILRQQITLEMEKKGVKDPAQIQFLELRKEDNSAHVLFYVPKCDDGGTGYAKLNGFYPLDSSWSSELRSKQLVTRVTKEFYRINGSCHYITVVRSKPSKVTIHYRPIHNVRT